MSLPKQSKKRQQAIKDGTWTPPKRKPMSNKRYFTHPDAEECKSKEDCVCDLSGYGNEEATVYPAKMIRGEPFFYCTEFGFVGGIGPDHEGCGTSCDSYEPRNGKSGRCRFSMNCYEPDTANPVTIKVDP